MDGNSDLAGIPSVSGRVRRTGENAEVVGLAGAVPPGLRVQRMRSAIARLTPRPGTRNPLATTFTKHLDGILNYCRTKVRFGVVEALNGNIRMLINRGRGYKNMRYLLLKAQCIRHEHRIRRLSEHQESRVECPLVLIPAESLY